MNMYQPVSIKDVRKFVRPGRFVRVRWTDSGATDCLVLEKKDDGYITKNTDFDGFFLDNREVLGFSADQIIAIGGFLKVDTGI